MARKNNNSVSRRGENFVSEILLEPVDSDDGPAMFSPEFMGDKAELLDFLVRLQNVDENVTGEYFFLQIKTVYGENQFDELGNMTVSFSAEEVQLAAKMRVPVYVVGVDARVKKKLVPYICALANGRQLGISKVPMTDENNLANDAVRKRLHTEVTNYFIKLREIADKSDLDLSSAFLPSNLKRQLKHLGKKVEGEGKEEALS